jgi:hypothetical protein
VQEFLERLRGAAADGEAQGEPAESSASATLLARVLDNVQMTICNLHVRYEDRMNAGGPCALGMRLAAVHVRSVDAHGRPRFVERRPGQPVSKMVEVRQLSLHLDVVGAEQGGGGGGGGGGLFVDLPDDESILRAFLAEKRAAQVVDDEAGASGGGGGGGGGASGGGGGAEAASAALGCRGRSGALLRPMSARLLVVLEPSLHRPAHVPRVKLQAQVHSVVLQLTRRQHVAAAHLLLYAQQHLCLERRARHAASRPTHCVRAGAAARAWWAYAAQAAAAEWGGRRMPLGAELLRVRREYLEAYRESLLADTGGPNLSAQVEPRPPST